MSARSRSRCAQRRTRSAPTLTAATCASARAALRSRMASVSKHHSQVRLHTNAYLIWLCVLMSLNFLYLFVFLLPLKKTKKKQRSPKNLTQVHTMSCDVITQTRKERTRKNCWYSAHRKSPGLKTVDYTHLCTSCTQNYTSVGQHWIMDQRTKKKRHFMLSVFVVPFLWWCLYLFCGLKNQRCFNKG